MLHAFGLRPFRSLDEKSGFRRFGRAARHCDLGRPGQPDPGGGSRRRAAGRNRGADPRRHAGDRNLQPALYRKWRALHDGNAHVLVGYGESAHHCGDLHPFGPPPGDGALRRPEAVHAGGEQAGALLRPEYHRRNGADGIARRGDRPQRRYSGACRRRHGHHQPQYLRAERRREDRTRQALFRYPDRDRPQGRPHLQGAREFWSRSDGW